MQGYDPETGSRPGAAARLEQMFVLISLNVLRWVSLFSNMVVSLRHWLWLYHMEKPLPTPRKGTACHSQILDAYLSGMQIAANGRVVVCDICPNQLLVFSKRLRLSFVF